jgi:hypothetical protein
LLLAPLWLLRPPTLVLVVVSCLLFVAVAAYKGLNYVIYPTCDCCCICTRRRALAGRLVLLLKLLKPSVGGCKPLWLVSPAVLAVVFVVWMEADGGVVDG